MKSGWWCHMLFWHNWITDIRFFRHVTVGWHIWFICAQPPSSRPLKALFHAAKTQQWLEEMSPSALHSFDWFQAETQTAAAGVRIRAFVGFVGQYHARVVPLCLANTTSRFAFWTSRQLLRCFHMQIGRATRPTWSHSSNAFVVDASYSSGNHTPSV